MKYIVGLALGAFVFSAFWTGAIYAQEKPTPQQCKEDPRRAGCQK